MRNYRAGINYIAVGIDSYRERLALVIVHQGVYERPTGLYRASVFLLQIRQYVVELLFIRRNIGCVRKVNCAHYENSCARFVCLLDPPPYAIHVVLRDYSLNRYLHQLCVFRKLVEHVEVVVPFIYRYMHEIQILGKFLHGHLVEQGSIGCHKKVERVVVGVFNYIEDVFA